MNAVDCAYYNGLYDQDTCCSDLPKGSPTFRSFSARTLFGSSCRRNFFGGHEKMVPDCDIFLGASNLSTLPRNNHGSGTWTPGRPFSFTNRGLSISMFGQRGVFSSWVCPFSEGSPPVRPCVWKTIFLYKQGVVHFHVWPGGGVYFMGLSFFRGKPTSSTLCLVEQIHPKPTALGGSPS